MVSASPRCALADGTTEVDIIARDAPTGDLTCRFVDYAVAEALRDANVAVNATETAYVAADAWASSQGDILGFIPAEAEAANQTAYDEWIAALDAQTEAYADALVATAFAVPVDAVVVSRAADANGDEITTARCATPAGDGQTLTVGLVNDGGAEGVDSVGAHYPLTPSEVTMLSADVRVRRTALDAVSPTSGPSTGGTSVAMTGKGFESPMTCVFHRDSVATNVVATVVNATHATCVSPHGSSRVDVELVFEDGCSLPFQFQYYNPPLPLVVRPSTGPRFGSVNITVFATNLLFLQQHPEFMTPRCSLGQTGDGEVGPAAATLPGYLSDDGASVVCPTPATMIPAGRHAVRLSFNDQQFAAPAASLGTEAVEFFANGPHLAMRRTVVHGSETVGEARVEVELRTSCSTSPSTSR